jgi:Transposase domain (DUF772)
MEFMQGPSRLSSGKQPPAKLFQHPGRHVAADNPVRLMDAFIDKLDLAQLGFTSTVHKSEGRPPYAPQVLLKLYLYGYLNRLRSSRKLEKECQRNIEFQHRHSAKLQNRACPDTSSGSLRLQYLFEKETAVCMYD